MIAPRGVEDHDPGPQVLTLRSQPDAVPSARRFARAVLRSVPADVAADVELVVTELVTNALLYGQPPVVVRVLPSPERVRVEVEDTGRTVPFRVHHDPETMTGRGLSMVDAVAWRWGVDPRRDGSGKAVWAELAVGDVDGPLAANPAAELNGPPAGSDGGAGPDRRATDRRATHRRASDRATAADTTIGDTTIGDTSPDETSTDAVGDPCFPARLQAVPTGLLLSVKAHIDNIVRELTLLREEEASSGVAMPAPLADLVQTLTTELAEARTEIKRQASAAAARGDHFTDVEVRLPSAAVDAADRYLAALDEADRSARRAQLLTLASPSSHVIFRRWYIRALVDQVRAQTRGEPPPSPEPFATVLTAEVDRLSHLDDLSTRLAMLREAGAALSTTDEPDEMAQIAVDHAARFPGVDTARAYLLTDHGTLRSAAWHTTTRPDDDPYAEFPLESDLPGATVTRTLEPMYLRSLLDIHKQFPQLAGYYPGERSLHLVPLAVGDESLGLLAITFFGGEASDEAQIGFVESLGGVLSQSLHRAQLVTSDDDARRTLAFLADATHIMVSSREPSEVVELLAQLAVPRIGDWCTVYLAEGEQLRRVAMAIDGFPHVAERLKALPLSLGVDVPQTRAFRTGGPVPIADGVGRLLGDLYPGLDFRALGGDEERSSGACVPIVLRGRSLGVIALTFLGSGRRITPRVLEALSGLASRAAIALDNAQRWSAQQQVVQSLVGALLPAEPPRVPGVEFAARHLPAGADVAGDWWEACLLPDGDILVGLGDAAGHGLDAVSEMCELRHGARALAAVEPSPAALLSDLNRRLAAPDAGYATAVYGRLDLATGLLRWASAGHVPPLHLHADGRVDVLAHAARPPLGVPTNQPPVEQRLVLRAGETLVLYSDGVVERRDQPIDDSIERLVATVARNAGSGVEPLADAIIAAHCSQPIDDSCLLLVRRPDATEAADPPT